MSTNSEFDTIQTWPLRLTDYDGADHQGNVKLTIDETTIPDGLEKTVVDDLNWTIEALNAVIRAPNLVLWVRSTQRDLLLAHQPADGHERAGHLRAATFESQSLFDPETVSELSIDTEIDAGLVTPFDAVNVLYDFLVGSGRPDSYALRLADVDALRDRHPGFTHPILTFKKALLGWGRHQTTSATTPIPPGADRLLIPFLESDA